MEFACNLLSLRLMVRFTCSFHAAGLYQVVVGFLLFLLKFSPNLLQEFLANHLGG